MPRLIALDIGTRRTGIAYGETNTGIVVALDTIDHAEIKELTEKLQTIIAEKKVETLIIGLPKLPQGKEGSQAKFVRETAKKIEDLTKLPMIFLDERFSTHNGNSDPDARAACELLSMHLDQQKRMSSDKKNRSTNGAPGTAVP